MRQAVKYPHKQKHIPGTWERGLDIKKVLQNSKKH